MRHPLARSILAVLLCVGAAHPALAQRPAGHFPLDHRTPEGVAARWNVIAQPGLHGYPQPVRVSLPVAASVTFFDGSAPEGVTVPAPGQARLAVGHVYRVKISGIDGYPGLELFPSIEVLDRLHPPAPLVDQYPIPIEITAEEIEAVLADRMVIKVVYLERQDLPRYGASNAAVNNTDVEPNRNLLETATHMGRPVAILRLGGRTPALNDRLDLLAPTAPLQVTLPTDLRQ